MKRSGFWIATMMSHGVSLLSRRLVSPAIARFDSLLARGEALSVSGLTNRLAGRFLQGRVIPLLRVLLRRLASLLHRVLEPTPSGRYTSSDSSASKARRLPMRREPPIDVTPRPPTPPRRATQAEIEVTQGDPSPPRHEPGPEVDGLLGRIRTAEIDGRDLKVIHRLLQELEGLVAALRRSGLSADRLQSLEQLLLQARQVVDSEGRSSGFEISMLWCLVEREVEGLQATSRW